MRSTVFVALAILLGLGILFARDRLKLAFQVGAILYAVLLVFRFVLFARLESDNVVDLAMVVGFFALVWLIGWAATTAVLRHRARSRTTRN